ncbi:uncharacterized protein B0H18DRAFT_1016612 [Fomitopsis serialis]|uniref:uncharacterized protein n=1 Tax=Fomitopsis serialis TaxID=139415 RepID=UPI00200821DA|nr:uncharacterized protein B0H18DRAFT_1016612 [Neoantrodia serialis]KAH9922716.1 hypothetical protein B0H18DRAFT_1016612 [Neoantrodia serialis]
MSTSVNLLSGPELVGSLLNYGLQGVLIAQVYIYHVCFPNDPLSLKAFVYGICIFELVQTALCSVDSFHVYVWGYGDQVDNLLSFYNGWFTICVMAGLVSAAVQSFFAWRILMMSRYRWLCAFIVTISLTQMSAAIVSGVKMKALTTDEDEAVIIPYIDTWLAGSALTDSVIAISMTLLLTRAKTGIRRSDAIIDRLIALGIETGTFTAVVAILDLLFFTIKPRTYLHSTPVLVLSKLYSNTLLINFNNRARTASLVDGNVMSMQGIQRSDNTASTLAGASHGTDFGLKRKFERVLAMQPSTSRTESVKPTESVICFAPSPETLGGDKLARIATTDSE